MVFGFSVTFVSDDFATEAMRLEINIITTVTNNTAEPRNEAKNVLKNDFIFYIINYTLY